MLWELDPSKGADLRPWHVLQSWLENGFATLKKSFGLLHTDRLTKLRNPAVHRDKPITRYDALEACRLCQGFLTALLSG